MSTAAGGTGVDPTASPGSPTSGALEELSYDPFEEETVRRSVRDDLTTLDTNDALEQDEAEQTVVNLLRWLQPR